MRGHAHTDPLAHKFVYEWMRQRAGVLPALELVRRLALIACATRRLAQCQLARACVPHSGAVRMQAAPMVCHGSTSARNVSDYDCAQLTGRSLAAEKRQHGQAVTCGRQLCGSSGQVCDFCLLPGGEMDMHAHAGGIHMQR
jgi:hypothetical protein